MNTQFAFGEFTDFKGLVHKFVVAGVVRKCCPDTWVDTNDQEYWAGRAGIEYGDKDLEKFLSIGISICSPLDKYDEKIGKLQAEGRALKPRKSELVREMYVTKGGMLSQEMVECAINITAKAIKKDPGQFVKGYNVAELKWKASQNTSSQEQ
jgi:hypothetical protein